MTIRTEYLDLANELGKLRTDMTTERDEMLDDCDYTEVPDIEELYNRRLLDIQHIFDMIKVPEW